MDSDDVVDNHGRDRTKNLCNVFRELEGRPSVTVNDLRLILYLRKIEDNIDYLKELD